MTPIFIEMTRLLPNRQRSNMFSPFNVVEPAQINLMQPTKETIFQRNESMEELETANAAHASIFGDFAKYMTKSPFVREGDRVWSYVR